MSRFALMKTFIALRTKKELWRWGAVLPGWGHSILNHRVSWPAHNLPARIPAHQTTLLLVGRPYATTARRAFKNENCILCLTHYMTGKTGFSVCRWACIKFTWKLSQPFNRTLSLLNRVWCYTYFPSLKYVLRVSLKLLEYFTNSFFWCSRALASRKENTKH